MKKQKLLLLLSITLTSVVLSSILINKNSFQTFSEYKSNWVHYNSVDPTLNNPGFKEFYVDCVSHTHSFTAPQESYSEGVWTQTKKDQIAAIENDDRYIKSFNEVDKIIENNQGYNPYDFININSTINYIDGNYNASAKAAYISDSNNVYLAKERYDSSFSYVLNTKTVSYYAVSDKFTVSQIDDSIYGPSMQITMNSSFSNTPNFDITNSNGQVKYFSSSLQSISFAIYSSEATNISFAVVYDNYSGGGTYFHETLKVGWNELVYKKGSTVYNLLTTSPDGIKNFTTLQVALSGSHNQNQVIKIASFIGQDHVQTLINKINNLPNSKDLTPYDISTINDLISDYNSLSSEEKALVTNYTNLSATKKYWESKYVLLYDMNASYANFISDASINEQSLFDTTYGATKLINFNTAGAYLKINNINNAYTTSSLTKIVYMVKPSQNCFMSWSQQDNYGRREYDGSTKLPDYIQTGNTWNEYEIKGTIGTKAAVERFMDDFSKATTAVIDFTSTTDRWNGYLHKVVGFNFQMSSIIGYKDLSKGVQKTIDAINALPEPSNVKISDSISIENAETLFENLTSSEKELVTNIEKLYECARVVGLSNPYLVHPSVYLTSPWQVDDIVTSNIVKGVSTEYGDAYKLPVSQQTWGVTLKLFSGELPYSSTGFDIYFKNYGKTIQLGKEYGVPLATSYGVSVGNDWYKYSFTVDDLNNLRNANITVLLVKIAPNIPTSGSVLGGTTLYMSGLFTKPEQNITDRNSVQAKINNIIAESNINEFSINALKSIQKDIYALGGYDQCQLQNADKIESLIAQYNQTFGEAYSLYCYTPGKYSANSSNSINLTTDSTYGTIAEFTQKNSYDPQVTLGCWNMKTYTGSYRGNGRSLSPLENGRYENIKFAVYSPVSGQLTINAYEDKDASISILTQSVNVGWNTITISGTSLDSLCGKSGTFKGLCVTMPKSSSGSTYKISNFIGTKSLTFTGEEYHYAQDSLHIGSKNLNSTNKKFIENGFSNYKIVTDNSATVSTAIEFFNNKLKSSMKRTFDVVSGLYASSNSRHIVFNDQLGMAELGATIPNIETLGESGYVIKTISNSIFVFAYGEDGYRNASIKLLQVLVGYDYFSEDYEIFEKNGVELTGNETIYIPDFNIIERPDYDYACASNDLDFAQYGSGLESRADIFFQKHVDIYDYLPTDTYKDCYYEINYDPTLDLNSSIVCFNAKGNETRRNDMIKTIGDLIIEDASLYPDRPYAAVFQGDSSKHCDCTTCKAQESTYGAASAADVLFMNDLDNYVKSNYKGKNIQIAFMAYNATKKAPTSLTCNEDVIPVIALLSARWNHSFYEVENSSGVGENGYKYDNDFAKIIEDWAKVSTSYTTYAYQIMNANFLYTYNTFESIFEQYRFFYNNGSRIMVNEGDWVDSGSGFISLKNYLDSKALQNVNEGLDDYYEKFFTHYYGAAGEYMRKIFEESLNNTNFLAQKYGRGSSYDPSSHATSTGSVVKTYYYDGAVGIDEPINYTKFWNNTKGIYNGETSSSHDNIANVKGWVEYANSAVAAVESTDPIAFKHVKRDVIFAYWADYEMFGTTTYFERICQYAYDTGVHWDNEKHARNDGYDWKNGTNTICYLLLGQTFKEKYNIK